MKPASFLLCLLLAALTAYVVATSARHASIKETTFERVMRTGTIRCGYYINSELMTQDNRTGKFSGPGYDIVNAVAANLDLKVEWVAEIGLASMAEDLKRGRFDMICTPLMANSARGKVMFYSRPVFFFPVHVWVRQNETRDASGLDWLDQKNVTFATIDGNTYALLMKRRYPKAAIASLPETSPVSDYMVMVATKKADATITSFKTGSDFARRNHNSIRIAGKKPVMLYNAQYPLPQGDERFRSMIDVALNELIYNGTLDAILDKYDTHPPGYYWRLSDPYQSPHRTPQ